MRILQIINSLSTGGAEKLLLDTIPLYVERDIEMDLLVLKDDDNCPFMRQLEERKCCNVYKLGSSSVYNPINIFKIIPYLKKYDLLHVHLFPAQYWVVISRFFSKSKPVLVFTEHSTSNRRLRNNFFRIFDRKVYRFYAKIVCISSQVQTIIKSHTNLNLDRLPVIENGVSLELIDKAKPFVRDEVCLQLSDNECVVIQVSGFREGKDQKTLIKAMSHLPSEFKLLLVGDGVLKDDCESLVISLGLIDRVFFLGVRTDVPSLLKTSDIVVLSSSHEGLSLSSIEGMVSGKPFVASDVPGLKEIVGGAGVLFEKGNYKQLADIIYKLNSNAELYENTVRKCRERAKQYDIKEMVNKHIELYESLVKKSY